MLWIAFIAFNILMVLSLCRAATMGDRQLSRLVATRSARDGSHDGH